MATQQLDVRAYAQDNLQIAGETFAAMADFLESLDQDGWTSPTGCAEWDMRVLAGHAAGECDWFPNLMRNAVRGEEMHPASLYDAMKSWPEARIIQRIREAADEFPAALQGSTPQHLEKTVDLGFEKMPVWQATFIPVIEGVFHGWDARAVIQPDATIPTRWAQQAATRLVELAPIVAHKTGVASSTGTYLLQVGDGVGPVTVIAKDGTLSVQRGAAGTPDVSVTLTADQYGRLIVGRLRLDGQQERDRVAIEGDRDRARDLNRIFGGVANET